MSKTIQYYNTNSEMYFEGTANVDFSETQKKFLDNLPHHAKILDFGCGSGRDTKAFLEKGFQVEAIDGSEELCRLASKFTGITVKQMYFQDFRAINKYDGIWACASILHLQWNDLISVLRNMSKALKMNGIIYMSFKYGSFSGERNGRYFTDLDKIQLEKLLSFVPELHKKDLWISYDVRPERTEEKWLNAILCK